MINNIENIYKKINNINDKIENMSQSKLNYAEKLEQKFDFNEKFSTIIKKYTDETEKKVETENSTKSVKNKSTKLTKTDKKNIDQIIKDKSKKYNVDADLIKSVIKHESNFKTDAVSNKGALGLMQLMPNTLKELNVSNALDAEENIDGGTKYLSQLLNKYNSNIKNALAAYNAGMGNVDKYKGVPPFKETQKYVKNILKDINKDKI